MRCLGSSNQLSAAIPSSNMTSIRCLHRSAWSMSFCRRRSRRRSSTFAPVNADVLHQIAHGPGRAWLVQYVQEYFNALCA